MKVILILIGKTVLFLCKLIGRGSAFPGSLIYKLNKNCLSFFKRPNLVISSTGSSGKGSTTKMIYDVMKTVKKTAYNDKGSNELSAVITTLLEHSTITGKPKVEALILEMDERYAPKVYPILKPDYIIITNITKDQPPRQRNIDFIQDKIKSSLNSNAHLIINADDPYLQSLTENNKTTYYGIEKTKYSYTKNKFEVLNIEYCPKCLTKLKYNFYHIETLGSYYCPNCNFKTPEKQFAITKIKDKTITINDKYQITLNNDMLFNQYNTLASLTTLYLCGIDINYAIKVINETQKNEKIYNIKKLKDKTVYIMNNKNENATTFNQSLLYTTRNHDKKTIVIGWWQISRRYDFDDLSWLYDIEFELLKNEEIEKVVVAGPLCYNIKTRLKYAKIDPKKILTYKDLYAAKNAILNSKHDIYAILNFDYIKPFNDILKETK